jgi:hypothetical protein
MTSMAKILGERISRDRLIKRVCYHFKRIFEMDLEEKNLEEVITGFSSPNPLPQEERDSR